MNNQLQAIVGERRPQPLDLTVTTNFGELESLVPEWLALWRRAERPTPFTAPGWLLAWWRHLGGGPLRTFVLRREGRLVGLLPMFVHVDRGVSRLLPLGISVSDAFDVLAEPEWSGQVAAALKRTILASGHGWERCELHEVPPGSALQSSATGSVMQSISPVLDLDWFAALPTRSGARRRAVRARRAALDAGLALDQPGLEALDSLFTLHAEQWRTRGEPGVLGSAPLQAFHREAARSLARLDMLRLQRLRDGTRTVGVLYGFQLRGRACAYASGIDPAYRRLGLGTVLIGAAIEQALADGALEFDFLRGTEPYKHAWGAVDQPLLRLDFLQTKPRPGLRALPGGLLPIPATE